MQQLHRSLDRESTFAKDAHHEVVVGSGLNLLTSTMTLFEG
jgi:hypothetical protein